MNTVAAHILARVIIYFSCGTRPGCADIIWSTPMVSTGFEMSLPRREITFPSLVFLKRHNFLWSCPNKHKTHGGALFVSFRNLVGRNTIYTSQNITVNGKCQDCSWRANNSYCKGERLTGLVSLSKSFSERLEAASVFSGIVVGIHPISGSSGARKDYFVASINSSLLVRTQNFNTALSSKKISWTFT